MSDPTMPAALREILSEPGWEQVADTGKYYKRVGDFASVEVEVGRWWIRRTFLTSRGSVPAMFICEAADLMRRIEQAIAPRAALAQEGTS